MSLILEKLTSPMHQSGTGSAALSTSIWATSVRIIVYDGRYAQQRYPPFNIQLQSAG